jgi:hypothetical protein
VRAHWVILLLVVLVACAGSALADAGLTCWTFGGNCATNGSVVAASDGGITGNLYYKSADFMSYVRVIDTNPDNAWTSAWMLNNQTTQIGGPPVLFGNALKGDVLIVELCDQTLNAATCGNGIINPYLFANDPKYSADGLSHAMVNQNGGASPTAKGDSMRTQLIWLEDLANKQNTDWDYNDLVLALHNIDVLFPNDGMSSGGLNASPVPEPATLSLLAGGLAAGLFRRLKKS